MGSPDSVTVVTRVAATSRVTAVLLGVALGAVLVGCDEPRPSPRVLEAPPLIIPTPTLPPVTQLYPAETLTMLPRAERFDARSITALNSKAKAFGPFAGRVAVRVFRRFVELSNLTAFHSSYEGKVVVVHAAMNSAGELMSCTLTEPSGENVTSAGAASGLQ
jgi:hypothetical protein